MNLSIAQKFLIFRDTTLTRLQSHSKFHERIMILIKDLELKVNILDAKIDQLEQALLETNASEPEDPF